MTIIYAYFIVSNKLPLSYSLIINELYLYYKFRGKFGGCCYLNEFY